MNDKTYPPLKFRKKPVVIEAWRIVPNSPQPSWVREAFAKSEEEIGAIDWDAAGEGMWINTLEGCMTANEGDWLIKGIKGELYACKPDIFEATYEAVDVDADREARGVPQGWKLVPVEPTEAMFTSFSQQIDTGVVYVGGFLQAYRAMIAAAPPAPAAQAEWVPADVVKALRMAIRQNSHDMLMTADEIRQCEQALATQPTEAQGVDVLREILNELERATTKFPTWPTDPLHALAVLGEEFGELTKGMVQLTYEPHKTSAEEVRTEAVQTAAMALRLAMSLGKYQYRASEQHAQSATPPQPTSKTGGA